MLLWDNNQQCGCVLWGHTITGKAPLPSEHHSLQTSPQTTILTPTLHWHFHTHLKLHLFPITHTPYINATSHNDSLWSKAQYIVPYLLKLAILSQYSGFDLVIFLKLFLICPHCSVCKSLIAIIWYSELWNVKMLDHSCVTIIKVT